MSWAEYLEATRTRPLNPFHDVLAPFLPTSLGRALDLGAGEGKTARWLAEMGWEVDAVEPDPGMVAAFRAHPPVPGVRLIPSSFDDAELGEYDLIVGVFSLFFQPRGRFDTLWARIRGALRPGGVFGGQLLGPQDDWVTGGRMITGYAPDDLSRHTREEVAELLAGWDVRHWEEVEREGTVATGGPKFWHVHHIVAQRPISG